MRGHTRFTSSFLCGVQGLLKFFSMFLKFFFQVLLL